MTYNLEFKPKALKEWSKLGSTIKEQFKNKLTQLSHIKPNCFLV